MKSNNPFEVPSDFKAGGFDQRKSKTLCVRVSGNRLLETYDVALSCVSVPRIFCG